MRRLLGGLAALLVLATTATAQAQSQSVRAGLTSATCPGSGCLVLSVSGVGGVAVQVTGTFVGTLSFEGSIDGVNYVPLGLLPIASTSAVTSTTSTGLWSGGVGGMAVVRVRMSAYTSGTATVSIQNAPTSSRATGGGGGGGGTIGGSISQYELAVGDASVDAITGIAPGTAGLAMVSNGAGANPSYQAVPLATGVSGDLAVSHLNGGTGASASTFWRGDGTWAAAGGGSGTIGGSIAAGQVPVGSGADTIAGSSNFLFDSTTQALTIGAASGSSAASFWTGYPFVYIEEQAGDLTPGFVSYAYSTIANVSGGNFPMRSRGTPASPTAVLSGDKLGVAVEPAAYTGAGWGYSGTLYMEAGENWSGTATGSQFVMKVTPNGENQTASKQYTFAPSLLTAPAGITAAGDITATGSRFAGAGIDISGNLSSAAWTTNGIRYKSTAGTLTDTTSSGTVAAAYTNVFGGNTIAASSATTYTDYFSTFVNVPTAGTNVTMTRKWGLGTNGNIAVAGGLIKMAATQTGCFDWNVSISTKWMFSSDCGSFNFAVDSTGPSSPQYNFGSYAGGTTDLILVRGAADTLAQYRSTNAQAYQLFNTRTDASNGEWATLNWASNVFHIGATKNGTGTARVMQLDYGGTTTAAISIPTTSTNPVTIGGAGLLANAGGSIGVTGASKSQMTTSGFDLPVAGLATWSSTATGGASRDTGIARVSAGVIEINNATAGTYGDILARGHRFNAVTFASAIATPTEGTCQWFTDSTTITFGATITGGGANHTMGCYDGTNWVVH